jgi:hypothetical protein
VQFAIREDRSKLLLVAVEASFRIDVRIFTTVEMPIEKGKGQF